MTVHYLKLPQRKPTPDQMHLPVAKVAEILHDLNATLLKLHGDLYAGRTAEEFAATIARVYEKVTEAGMGFAGLVEITRGWK